MEQFQLEQRFVELKQYSMTRPAFHLPISVELQNAFVEGG